jgi:MoaA/NifB/PqqE/SkfB family radical SAM enzyme
LTTNGTHLESWIDSLLASNVMAYAISMHAAKPETHQDLMGFKPRAFEKVKRAVRMLTARKAEFPQLFVELVLVVTRQNIAEIPSFIAMSEDLGADQVHLRTLMPMESPRDGLDYHRLPPYLHPEFGSLHAAALAAISKTRLQVKADPATWARPVFSPEWERRLKDIPLTPRNERSEHYIKMKEIDWNVLGSGGKSCSREVPALADNLYDRSAPLYCPSPYTAFYVNGTDRRVIPCVYMHEVPGHDLIHFKPSMTFEEVWNSPAMVAVRHSLHHGPLMPTCLKCPFYC